MDPDRENPSTPTAERRLACDLSPILKRLVRSTEPLNQAMRSLSAVTEATKPATDTLNIVGKWISETAVPLSATAPAVARALGEPVAAASLNAPNIALGQDVVPFASLFPGLPEQLGSSGPFAQQISELNSTVNAHFAGISASLRTTSFADELAGPSMQFRRGFALQFRSEERTFRGFGYDKPSGGPRRSYLVPPPGDHLLGDVEIERSAPARDEPLTTVHRIELRVLHDTSRANSEWEAGGALIDNHLLSVEQGTINVNVSVEIDSTRIAKRPSPAFTGRSEGQRQCFEWLCRMIRANPNERIFTREEIIVQARGKWPRLSKAAIDEARRMAIRETGASAWAHQGRPKR